MITFYSHILQKTIFIRVYHLRELCRGIWGRSVCHIHGRCVLKSKHFHWKLMAQRETGQLLIKAQQLTSQHMLDELLKIQVTPCEEINCCSSCIGICNMSALEAEWRLFFISLNQNGSLSFKRMCHGRLKLGYTSGKTCYRSLTEGREAFQGRSLVLDRMIKRICSRDETQKM